MDSSTVRVGGLYAQATGNIYLVELTNELYVQGLSYQQRLLPSVFLTVREDATAPQRHEPSQCLERVRELF